MHCTLSAWFELSGSNCSGSNVIVLIMSCLACYLASCHDFKCGRSNLQHKKFRPTDTDIATANMTKKIVAVL